MTRGRAPERRGNAAFEGGAERSEGPVSKRFSPRLRPGVDMVTTDEELLREMARGEPDAVGLFYERHAAAVFGMAAQAFDAATAEEIVQDVFLAAWRGAASFDPERGSARPWLFAIARHRIANELRRRSRRPADGPAGDDGVAAALPDQAPDQAEALWRRRRGEILRAAIARLPAGERAALGLAYFEDLPHGAIASLLRIPLGTAKSRIRSGVARLRLQLGPLVATLAVAILVALAVRYRTNREALARGERALDMLTSSDSVALRMTATAEAPPEAHATYRFRHGSAIAVVTLSHFPKAPPGETYRVWARLAGRWVAVGDGGVDENGRARLVAEGPAFDLWPEALAVSRERGAAGGSPSGPILVRWPNPAP